LHPVLAKDKRRNLGYRNLRPWKIMAIATIVAVLIGLLIGALR